MNIVTSIVADSILLHLLMFFLFMSNNTMFEDRFSAVNYFIIG